VLLQEPDEGVQHHHAQHHPRIRGLAHPQGQGCGAQQHIDQRVVDLAAQEGPGAFTTGPREVVGAHLGFPCLGLLEIEAGKAAAQALERGLGSLGVEG